MIHTKKKQVLVAMVTSGTNYPYSNSGNKKGIKKSSQRSIQVCKSMRPGKKGWGVGYKEVIRGENREYCRQNK